MINEIPIKNYIKIYIKRIEESADNVDTIFILKNIFKQLSIEKCKRDRKVQFLKYKNRKLQKQIDNLADKLES